jgi:FAD:protein FMN transferase
MLDDMVLNSGISMRPRVRQSAVFRSEDGLSILSFHAMGTCCQVRLVEPSRAATNTYWDTLLNWVADFEAKYSRFLDSSLISRINAAAGKHWMDVDEDMDRILGLCHNLYFFSRGAFDPTALPLIRLWNWKANPPQVPNDDSIRAARELVGWDKVERKPGSIFLPREGMCLDFGGICKEYAVNQAIAMAAQHGVEDVLVDFGQDIRVHGKPTGEPAWNIGLEDPKNPGTCWASVAVTDHAVASSGDYFRHFVHAGRRYGHIVDPRTGYPVCNDCLAVSVVAPNCTLAGILTTTAFILGPQDGFQLIKGYRGASGTILTANSRIITPGFHEHLVEQC